MSPTEQLPRPDERPRRRLRAPARRPVRGAARAPSGPSARSPRAAWTPSPSRCPSGTAACCPAPDPDAPSIVIREPSALAYLLHAPGQVGLGRAWVSGAIDVDGDLEAVLAARGHFEAAQLSRPTARAWRSRRCAPPDRECSSPRRAGVRGAHGRAAALAACATGRRSGTTTTSPTRFYAAAARPSMVYSCAYFEAIRRFARGRAGAQARADLPQAPAAAGRAPARHRLRLGLAAAARRRAPRGARRRRDAVGRAGRARARADPRRRAGRPGRGARARLSRARRRAVRQDRQRRHVRARRPRRARPYVAHVHRLLRPGGLFLNHGIARLRSAPPDGDDLHLRATSSPTASCTP